VKNYFLYIVASAKNGTIYIGVTNNLSKRVWEHKNKIADGFTSKYIVDKLVYYEVHSEVLATIGREKRLKEWPRKWKLALIEKTNPNWTDLYEKIHF
jgi:putative endonuclease